MDSMLLVVAFSSSILQYLCFVEGQNQMSQVSRSIDAVPISLQDYKLNGFHYKVVYSVSLIGCGQACLTDFPKCVSYNYYMKSMGQETCELNSKGINSVAEGRIAGSLEKDSDSVFVQTRTPFTKYPAKTCADHYKMGFRESGLYYIQDDNNQFFQVICDFTSEPNKVWTLIMSCSFPNKGVSQFSEIPLFVNGPLKEDTPNWDYYRLSLPRMQHINRSSTHWRITCNFPKDGLNYVDYVRAKISEFDMISFKGNQVCKRLEYINVMNHNCSVCTAAWWQNNGYIFHHDITEKACDFGATPGGINSQDVFGWYASFNTKFRCCLSDDSNTNHWFGSEV